MALTTMTVKDGGNIDRTVIVAANGSSQYAATACLVDSSGAERTTFPVTDNGGSLTVDGTVGISGTVPVTDNGGSLTVDGTVTVQDGGGSITVDGTVGVSGTVAVTDNSGSLTVDAPVGTPVFVRLSDGTSAITTLPVSLASVPSHQVTNAGTFAVQATLQTGSNTIGALTANQSVNNTQINGNTIATGSGANGNGVQRVTIATDDSTIIPASTAYSKISVGTSQDQAVVKASAGVLYNVDVGNINAAYCVLKLYNMATNPSSSDTPVQRYIIPGNTAGAGRTLNFPNGLNFSTGIALRITTGIADNNTTGVAASEVTVNLGYT